MVGIMSNISSSLRSQREFSANFLAYDGPIDIVNMGVVELSPRRCTDLTMKGSQPNFWRDEHTCLKCNLVNFGFLYHGIYFQISKMTRLHFKQVCSSLSNLVDFPS